MAVASICTAGIFGCARDPGDSAERSTKGKTLPELADSPGPLVERQVQKTPSTPADTEGHARMLSVLKEFARQAKSDHPILGDRQMRRLRGELDEVTLAERDNGSIRVLQLHWRLGNAELRLGNLDRGIEHLTKAYNGMKQLKGAEEAPPGLAFELTYQLAVAHMRRGETQNCCLRNSPDSCLLPIRGSGVHTRQDGSNQAIAYFAQLLQAAPHNSPGHVKAKWLLNIMYMTVGGYPDQVPKQYLIPPSRFASDEPFPRFRNVAGSLGLDTFSLLGGAVVDDFTGDGYLDIVVSTYDPKWANAVPSQQSGRRVH